MLLILNVYVLRDTNFMFVFSPVPFQACKRCFFCRSVSFCPSCDKLLQCFRRCSCRGLTANILADICRIGIESKGCFDIEGGKSFKIKDHTSSH